MKFELNLAFLNYVSNAKRFYSTYKGFVFTIVANCT